MSEANNKVPGNPLKIFDFVSGSGSYIILAKQIYHTATPYIISHKRYIIENNNKLWYNQLDKLQFVKQMIHATFGCFYPYLRYF